MYHFDTDYTYGPLFTFFHVILFKIIIINYYYYYKYILFTVSDRYNPCFSDIAASD
jgi:hypothetical protein